MGMYDTFSLKSPERCMNCNAESLNDFQTKDLGERMEIYHQGDKVPVVDNTSVECYNICSVCRAWNCGIAVVLDDTFMGIKLYEVDKRDHRDAVLDLQNKFNELYVMSARCSELQEEVSRLRMGVVKEQSLESIKANGISQDQIESIGKIYVSTTTRKINGSKVHCFEILLAAEGGYPRIDDLDGKKVAVLLTKDDDSDG